MTTLPAMYRRGEQGWVEVICGPMFSGKSEELIRRVTRSKIARIPVQTFKPAIDVRYAQAEVVSHSSLSVEASPVVDSAALLKAIEEATVVVGIAPVTGLPLPFMSAGGSTFVTMAISLGVANSVWLRRSPVPGETYIV